MNRTYRKIARLALIALTSFSSLHAQTITTIAGNGVAGTSGDGGPAVNAKVDGPYQVAVDTAGNVYFADYAAHRVRKINKTGIISTIAGTGAASSSGNGGPATAADVRNPIGVAIDLSGNIFITEYHDGNIRKIDPAGIITAFAGGIGTPTHLCTDTSGNLYVASQSSARVMKITPAGVVSTYAGNSTGTPNDGVPATDASLDPISGVAADRLGNIYLSSWNGGRVRKVDASGIISTIAGKDTIGFAGDGGPATLAKFNQPYGISADSAGNVYIADNANNRIRYVSAATGIITTIAGNGSAGFNGDNIPATASCLSSSSVAVDAKGNYYFNSGARIRKVTLPVPVVGVSSRPDQIRLTVYPNPGKGLFKLIVEKNSPESVNVIITNIKGEQVAELTTAANRTTNVSIDQPPGTYFLTAYTKNGSPVTKMLVIQ